MAEKASFSFTIKQSPILLVMRIIVLFVFFNCAYLGIAFASDYYEGFNSELVFNVIAYDTMVIFLVMVFQVILTLYLFLKWFSESYTLKEGYIIHRWGILLIRERRFKLDNVESITYVQSILGRIFQYGTIQIRYPSDERVEQLSAVAYPDQFVGMVEHNLTEHKK